MNKEQVKGAVEKASGKVKEGFGKMTGNPDTQAKGKFDQAKGQARQNVGDAQEVLAGSSKGQKVTKHQPQNSPPIRRALWLTKSFMPY